MATTRCIDNVATRRIIVTQRTTAMSDTRKEIGGRIIKYTERILFYSGKFINKKTRAIATRAFRNAAPKAGKKRNILYGINNQCYIPDRKSVV